MTVTREVLREVADHFELLGLSAAANEAWDESEKVEDREAADGGPNGALASTLRTAYYDDGDVYYAKYSSVPGQWLRMAQAARKQVEAELDVDVQAAQFVKRKPRVWKYAQSIPLGVTYVDNSGDKYVVHEDGIWQAREDGMRGTSQDGVTFAPYTEVLS